MKSAEAYSLEKVSFDPAHPTSTTSLVAIRRSLSPQSKTALELVAGHPLLSLDQIVLLSQQASLRVRLALQQLVGFQLVRQVSQEIEVRWLLTSTGIAYLAAVAGYGRAVKRFARLRGWKGGLESVVRHWKHTQVENRLFLQLAEMARTRHARLTWRSEFESRLYYQARGRRWSLLPDGGGVYQDRKRRIRVAVEIDRTRASASLMRVKLAQYYAYIQSPSFGPSEGEEFRLLVVTSSWERARHLRQLLLDLRHEAPGYRLRVWLTTFDLLDARGAGEAIWREVDQWERCYCIEL